MAAVGPALARCARYSEKMVDPGVHQASAAVLPCVVVIQSRKRCSRTTRPRSRGGLQLSERCQKLSLAQVLELARNLVPLAASITHHEVDLVNRVDGARHTETGCRSRQPRRSPSHSSTGTRADLQCRGWRASAPWCGAGGRAGQLRGHGAGALHDGSGPGLDLEVCIMTGCQPSLDGLVLGIEQGL